MLFPLTVGTSVGNDNSVSLPAENKLDRLIKVGKRKLARKFNLLYCLIGDK